MNEYVGRLTFSHAEACCLAQGRGLNTGLAGVCSDYDTVLSRWLERKPIPIFRNGSGKVQPPENAAGVGRMESAIRYYRDRKKNASND